MMMNYIASLNLCSNSLRFINVDKNPQITTLGLKKCLSMLLDTEQHFPPTLDRLLLSTKTLLNEENKSIIEKINSVRRSPPLTPSLPAMYPEKKEELNSIRRAPPPLYIGDGEYFMPIEYGGRRINWVATAEKVHEFLQKKESSSRSAR